MASARRELLGICGVCLVLSSACSALCAETKKDKGGGDLDEPFVTKRWSRATDWSCLSRLPKGAERDFKAAVRAVCKLLAERDDVPLERTFATTKVKDETGKEREIPSETVGRQKRALAQHFEKRLSQYWKALQRLERIASDPDAGQWADDAKVVALLVCGTVTGDLVRLGRGEALKTWWQRDIRVARELLARFDRPAVDKWTLAACPVQDIVELVLACTHIGPVQDLGVAIRCFARVKLILSVASDADLDGAEAQIGGLLAEGIAEQRLSYLRHHLGAVRRLHGMRGGAGGRAGPGTDQR